LSAGLLVLGRRRGCASGTDQDDIILMPLLIYHHRIAGNTDSGNIVISAKDDIETARVQADIERLIRERRKDEGARRHRIRLFPGPTGGANEPDRSTTAWVRIFSHWVPVWVWSGLNLLRLSVSASPPTADTRRLNFRLASQSSHAACRSWTSV